MSAVEDDTPDSWEQGNNNEISDSTMDVEQLGKDLSSVLNVNAMPFVPGQNVFAKAFVPVISTDDVTAEEDIADVPKENENSESQPVTENEIIDVERSSPDDWEGIGSSDGGGGEDEGSEGDNPMETDEEVAEVIHIPKKDLKKSHLNIVFIGHVDAGKSTIGGHIMYLTGMVEKRTLEKYEREAKEKNRESWYLSWALDTNQEERDKGKTVEVGRAYFETDTKHFTILDAPGHKSFVPNMIGGASQADVAVLVISARKGEFETGFERGGQTREHAMLVKTAGVKHLIVVVNKMDDHTVNWDKERYNEIIDKLTPYLKKCGFNPKTDLHFIPVSGITGAFLKDPDPKCTFYTGKPLIPYLDELQPMSRMAEGPVRIPIVDRYKDMGTMVLGKVESGVIKKGQILQLMPNKVNVEVTQLWSDEVESESANPGENVKVKLKNVEEEDVSPGFVLCTPEDVCQTGHLFDAQVVILEHKSIICAGYSAVLHVHTCAEEVSIKVLISLIDKKTGEKTKARPRFIKQDQTAIVRFEVNGGVICLEPFKKFPQMGRFTLRDEGKTIAIGKVLKIIKQKEDVSN